MFKKKKGKPKTNSKTTSPPSIKAPPEMKVDGWWRISFVDPDDLNKSEQHIGYIIREGDTTDWGRIRNIILSDFASKYGRGTYLIYPCDIDKKPIPDASAIKVVIDDELVEDVDMVDEDKENQEGSDSIFSVIRDKLERQLLTEHEIRAIERLYKMLHGDTKKEEEEDDDNRPRRTRYREDIPYVPHYSRFRDTGSEVRELRQTLELLKTQLLGEKKDDSKDLYAVILQMNQSQMEARKQELELQRQRLEHERLRLEQEMKLKEQEIKEKLEQEKQRLDLEREKLRMEQEKYEKELRAKEREYELKLREERERLKAEREMRDKEMIEREDRMRQFQASENQRWSIIIETLQKMKEKKTEYPQELLNAISEQARIVQKMSSSAIGNQLELVKKIGDIFEQYGIIPPLQPTPPPEEVKGKPETNLFDGLTKVISALTPFIESQKGVPLQQSVPPPVQNAAKVLLPKTPKPTNRIKQLFGKDKEMLKALLIAMKKKDNPTLYVGSLGHLCGDLTPVVCNLPWNDVKNALSELVDDAGKRILNDSETEKWWKALMEATKKAMIAVSKQQESK